MRWPVELKNASNPTPEVVKKLQKKIMEKKKNFNTLIKITR